MAAVALLVAATALPDMTPVERLNAELLAGRTATQTLEKWCAASGLADPARVHAQVERREGRVIASASPARTRLKVGKHELLGYRKVRLMCGDHVLSEATNWYVPARLTAEMNAALDGSDVPFGRVILPLAPRRQTLSARILWDGKDTPPAVILRHRALVIDAQGRPLAEVTENYRAVLITGDIR